MARNENIVIGDRSAIHLYLHSTCGFMNEGPDLINPLDSCATTSEGLHAFNTEHPLYGNMPVELLVPRREYKRRTAEIVCRSTEHPLPPHAFYQLRPGLHIASPELAFARMGRLNRGIMELAEIATNLCARYYIDPAGKIQERPHFVTTLERLSKFLAEAKGMDGASKAAAALRFAMANSGSPLETKTMLQFCSPFRKGGANLPFKAMNYDVRAGRLAHLLEQENFCLDLADPMTKIGLEYDGKDSHQNPSDDMRRRNELKVLNWTVYPIDQNIIYNPDATIRTAKQLAKLMSVRFRPTNSWHEAFVQLRKELDLPF